MVAVTRSRTLSFVRMVWGVKDFVVFWRKITSGLHHVKGMNFKLVNSKGKPSALIVIIAGTTQCGP